MTGTWVHASRSQTKPSISGQLQSRRGKTNRSIVTDAALEEEETISVKKKILDHRVLTYCMSTPKYQLNQLATIQRRCLRKKSIWLQTTVSKTPRSEIEWLTTVAAAAAEEEQKHRKDRVVDRCTHSYTECTNLCLESFGARSRYKNSKFEFYCV